MEQVKIVKVFTKPTCRPRIVGDRVRAIRWVGVFPLLKVFINILKS
jgi:hypothetical protein